MGGQRTPGPMCQAEDPVWVKDGTMCLAPTQPPGPLGLAITGASGTAQGPTRLATAQQPEREFQEVSISFGAETAWDSAVREVYTRGAQAIRAQAQDLVRTGQMTTEQAMVWSNGQRNALMQACREQSSPLGKAIAEAIKPAPKSVRELEALGKSAEGMIESAGRTNPYVNRVAVGFRYGGPTLLIVGLTFSAYHIATAPEDERWPAVFQEVGIWGGALAGGWAGGAAGCKLGGAVGTLVEPGGGTAVGCAAGGFMGTLGGAIAGGWAGSQTGEYLYRASSTAQDTQTGR